MRDTPAPTNDVSLPHNRKGQDYVQASMRASMMVDLMHEQHEEPTEVVIDTEQVYMLYATFCGDAQRAAGAAGITADKVREMAARFDWDTKLAGLIALRKSERAGDVERGMNRAMNYVQAHRYRLYLEKIMRKITEMSFDDTMELFKSARFNKKDEVVGTTVSFKPLSDLAAALEKVQWMTYQALCDSSQDRARRPEVKPDEHTEDDIHARISKAMATMRLASQPARAALPEPTANPQ